MLNKNQKVQIVDTLESEFSDASMIILSDYTGINVNEMSDLRKELASKGFHAKISKNRLVKRAFKKLNYNVEDSLLKGQNIFFNSKEDTVGLSKSLVDFAKNNEKLKIKGGLLDGNFVSTDEIVNLSKLPSKEELIAQLIGQLKNPINKFVMTLSNPINGFAHVLTNIKNKIGGD